jgi:hypothetical protein
VSFDLTIKTKARALGHSPCKFFPPKKPRSPQPLCPGEQVLHRGDMPLTAAGRANAASVQGLGNAGEGCDAGALDQAQNGQDIGCEPVRLDNLGYPAKRSGLAGIWLWRTFGQRENPMPLKKHRRCSQDQILSTQTASPHRSAWPRWPRILALGLVRLRARQSSHLSADHGRKFASLHAGQERWSHPQRHCGERIMSETVLARLVGGPEDHADQRAEGAVARALRQGAATL